MWERACGNACVPEVGKDEDRPQEPPEKWGVTADSAEQRPGPATKPLEPKQELASDVEEVIDVDWEDYAGAAGTDDEPQ